MRRLIAVIFFVVAWPAAEEAGAATTEYCLVGEQDFGMRLQGLSPEPGEFYDARFCIISEDESTRVRFSASGNSNPDMWGEITVAYLPAEAVVMNSHSSRRTPVSRLASYLETTACQGLDSGET